MQMKQGLNQLDSSHTFLAMGMGSFALFPILLIVTPMMVAKTLHETPSTILLQIPQSAYVTYGIGLLLLTITCFLLSFLRVSKKAKQIGAVIVLLAVFCFVDASQRFARLGWDTLAFKKSIWSETYEYTWDDIDKVVFREVPIKDDTAKFDFHFQDGNRMTLSNNEEMKAWRKKIEQKFEDDGIEYKRG